MTQETRVNMIEKTQLQRESILIVVQDFGEDSSAVAGWSCEFCAFSENAVPLSESIKMSLMDACKAVADMQSQNETVQITVVLPAELAALHSVNLPSKNQRQAMQALPFVVEEQLAVDIEEVHLAVGQRQSDASWPVVVIDNAVMAALSQCCESAGVRLSAVYIDAQLLPIKNGGLTLVLAKQRVLVRTEKSVAVFDAVNAAEMIDFFLADTTPSAVNIYYSSEDESSALLAQKFATEFSALEESSVEVKSDMKALAPQLFSWIDAASINLLQGKFFVKPLSGRPPMWRWIAAAVVFFWLGQCVLQIASGWYFSRSASALEEKMDAQFRELFPSARRVGGVRKQIESQFMGLGDSNTSTFIEVFGVSVQALNAMPSHQGLEIMELRYDDQQGQLEFELKAKSIEQLDQYKQALSKAGLSAKISSANEGENGVEGRMQISKNF
ncbi:MAG: type II secretion system protein GspL [Pseudomonadales bacterium]